MIKLDKIHFDGTTWDFSEYFEYIRSVAHLMPQPLGEYSTDWESYALSGTKTLHDARLLSAILDKKYDGKYSNVVSSVELSFIDQMFQGKTTLRYGDVSSYLFKETDSDTHLHADVLVHEFSIVSPGRFRHRIVLDHSGEIEIEFGTFSHVWKKEL